MLGVSTNVLAVKNFKCSVQDAKKVSENGLLVSNNVTKIYIGREFVVDRESGKMIGEVTNHNSGFIPKVFDYLPSENGYKVVTTYSPHPSIDYLHIVEYVESLEKPFFYTTGSTIMSGKCVYF